MNDLSNLQPMQVAALVNGNSVKKVFITNVTPTVITIGTGARFNVRDGKPVGSSPWNTITLMLWSDELAQKSQQGNLNNEGRKILGELGTIKNFTADQIQALKQVLTNSKG